MEGQGRFIAFDMKASTLSSDEENEDGREEEGEDEDEEEDEEEEDRHVKENKKGNDQGENEDEDEDEIVEVDIVSHQGHRWTKVKAINGSAAQTVMEGDGQYGQRSILRYATLLCKIASSWYSTNQFVHPRVYYTFLYKIPDEVSRGLSKAGVTVLYLDESSYQTPEPELESEKQNERVNLDITTIIAMASDLTNGYLHEDFIENYLRIQVRDEKINPILPVLHRYFEGKKLVACKTAVSRATQIIDLIGGPREKQRLKELVQQLEIVEDSCSEKIQALQEGRKIGLMQKIVFGTGDSLKMTTVTSNQSFLRAAASFSVQIPVFLHAPRALSETSKRASSMEGQNGREESKQEQENGASDVQIDCL